MKVSRKSFVFLVAGVVAALGAYTAVPAIAQPDPNQRPGGAQARGPSLESAMKQMERSYKALARQLDDASKDEQSLRAISMLQAGAATAKGMVPHTIEEKPEAERAAALVDYRKRMLEVLKTAIELEETLLAGDRAAAKAALEKLHTMEEEGHKKYAPEDHDH